jgi:hypothetical protein
MFYGRLQRSAAHDPEPGPHPELGAIVPSGAWP